MQEEWAIAVNDPNIGDCALRPGCCVPGTDAVQDTHGTLGNGGRAPIIIWVFQACPRRGINYDHIRTGFRKQ